MTHYRWEEKKSVQPRSHVFSVVGNQMYAYDSSNYHVKDENSPTQVVHDFVRCGTMIIVPASVVRSLDKSEIGKNYHSAVSYGLRQFCFPTFVKSFKYQEK